MPQPGSSGLCLYQPYTKQKPGVAARAGRQQPIALPHGQSCLISPIFFPISLKNRGVSCFLAGKQSVKREGSVVHTLAPVIELQISPFHLHVATSKSPAREIFASVGLAQARGWTEVFGVECYSPCELGACHAVRRHPASGPTAKLCHGNPATR